MRKQGFTLVELLAVIAILAILVIIALPNVMGMFNQAKKNSFTTEIKEVYKIAQQEWMSESLFSTGEKIYARCDNTCPNTLDLSGRTELHYYIKINKAGNVVEYYASDGTYQYEYKGNGLKIEDITDVEQITDLADDEIMNITCSGSGTSIEYVYLLSDNATIGSALSASTTTYSTPESAMNSKGYDFFLRVAISDGIVTKINPGFKINNNIYYLKGADGGTSYNENMSLVKSIFGESNCGIDIYDAYSCTNGTLTINITEAGFASVAGSAWYCTLTDMGYGFCFND